MLSIALVCVMVMSALTLITSDDVEAAPVDEEVQNIHLWATSI